MTDSFTKKFKEYGLGIVAKLNHNGALGWYYVAKKYINSILADNVLVKFEWWNGIGFPIKRSNVIFIWQQCLPIVGYGPIDLNLISPHFLRTFPFDVFYLHEELISQNMLRGNMHAVAEVDIVTSTDQMYVPATDGLWEVIHRVYLDDENDAIVATAMIDDLVYGDTQDRIANFKSLIDKAGAVQFSYSHAAAKRYGVDFNTAFSQFSTQPAGLINGQLNIISSATSAGRSRIYDVTRKQMNNKLNRYLTGREVIATTETKKKPKTVRPQHRITSVQQRDKSVRRYRRR